MNPCAKGPGIHYKSYFNARWYKNQSIKYYQIVQYSSRELFYGMLIADLGILISIKLMQFQKAPLPMVWIDSGRVTLFKFSQLPKAVLPITFCCFNLIRQKHTHNFMYKTGEKILK